MGGDNRLSNVVPLCRECHSKAHSKRNNEKEWRAGRHLLPMPSNFFEVADEYLGNSITLGEALKKAGASRNTFYRFLDEYKEKTGDTRHHKNSGNRKNHSKRTEGGKQCSR
jgi:hypothetical protein